jgi:hypothetical protein
MNIKTLLEKIGNQCFLGREIGVSRHTVKQWKDANNIPIKYWNKLIELDPSLSYDSIAKACLNKG